MDTGEARALVLSLIVDDLLAIGRSDLLDPRSPVAKDQFRFVLAGKGAKVVNPRDGGYVQINLDWFRGSLEPPVVWGEPFHWYVFALQRKGNKRAKDHYFICDYRQMREWVLDFASPLGRDHQDHRK